MLPPVSLVQVGLVEEEKFLTFAPNPREMILDRQNMMAPADIIADLRRRKLGGFVTVRGHDADPTVERILGSTRCDSLSKLRHKLTSVRTSKVQVGALEFSLTVWKLPEASPRVQSTAAPARNPEMAVAG